MYGVETCVYINKFTKRINRYCKTCYKQICRDSHSQLISVGCHTVDG